MSEFICDFCSAAISDLKQAWIYPCMDFQVVPVTQDGPIPGVPLQRSLSSWLACEPCAVVVEGGDPKRLAEFIVYKHVSLRASKRLRAVALNDLGQMYAGFYSGRTGARHRPTAGDVYESETQRAASPGVCHLGTLLEPCDEKAAVEVRMPAFRNLEWWPACFACARIELGLATGAHVPAPSARTRSLSGKAPYLR